MVAPRYVKFVRGTQEMYDELIRKDPDTLYFVYEDANAEKGKLYLGNKLISNTPGANGIISLSQISDIVIDQGLSHGDLLIYNDDTGKWESRPVADAIAASVMIGATEDAAGTSGLVPVPAAGDQSKFLRGDGQWQEVVPGISPEDAAILYGLQSAVTTLIGEDIDKSVSEIVTELLIPEDAREDLNSVQKVADWIQAHPVEVEGIKNRLTTLENNVGIVQSDVSNLDEILNGTEAHPELGLTSRVIALENTVGNFTPVPSKYLTVGSAISYLDDFATTIDQHLRWHDLTDNTNGI